MTPGGRLLIEHLERKAQSLLLPSRVSFLLFYTLARETQRLSWRAAGFASRSAHTPTIGGSWRFWIIRVKSSSAVRRGQVLFPEPPRFPCAPASAGETVRGHVCTYSSRGFVQPAQAARQASGQADARGGQGAAAYGGDPPETRTGTAGPRTGDSVSASGNSSNVLEGARCF